MKVQGMASDKENEKIEVLSRSFWQCPTDSPTLTELLKISRFIDSPADHVFFRAGDDVPDIFVVAHGTITLSQSNPAGHTHVLRVLRERGVFGEAAVFGQFPAPVTAECSTPCRVLAIDASQIRNLVQRDHGACLSLLQSICGRVSYLLNHVEEMRFSDARMRVARFLVEQAEHFGTMDFSIDFSKRRLAQQLNLRSETLSRVLRDLSQQGLVEVQGCRFLVQDLQTLKKLEGL